MELLEFVTSPFIYHGLSIWRTLWEEKFTGEENFTLGELTAVNIKNCGHQNVRKHREIKGSDKYITLDILLKYDSIDNMRITSSESKDNVGISGKGFSTSLGLKAKVRPKRYKKARYNIGNVSKEDLSKIIREFDKLNYKSFERWRHKNEPTESYFYLAIQLLKCMIRADELNLHVYPVRTEMTNTKQILVSHVCFTDESELKDFLVNKTLSQIFSTDEDE